MLGIRSPGVCRFNVLLFIVSAHTYVYTRVLTEPYYIRACAERYNRNALESVVRRSYCNVAVNLLGYTCTAYKELKCIVLYSVTRIPRGNEFFLALKRLFVGQIPKFSCENPYASILTTLGVRRVIIRTVNTLHRTFNTNSFRRRQILYAYSSAIFRVFLRVTYTFFMRIPYTCIAHLCFIVAFRNVQVHSVALL